MNVAVIGGGLAGLSCACALAETGHTVTLYERRPWAGGKAYSFVDQETGEAVDNGQHIFMRCTTAYVDFLRRIGTPHLTRIQDRLRVPVINAEGRTAVIAASPLPSPMHLLPSFASYGHLTVVERGRVAQAIPSIARLHPDERNAVRDRTFADWLRQHGQGEDTIRDFWDMIVVPTLNCRSEQASAAQALFVLQEGFLGSSDSAAIGLPVAALSDIHVSPAIAYIRERGGDVRVRNAVGALNVADDTFVSLTIAGGRSEAFDACVLALPPAQALSVLPQALRAQAPFEALGGFQTSPIVNVHLWFDGPVADFEFAAFTGCELQWLFNRTRITSASGDGEEHVVLSLSAAGAFLELEKQELLARLLPQLERALPAVRARRLLRAAVIKEIDATFLPAPAMPRPGNRTPIRNLVLAGAYTDTGWPATMESAVRSGMAAAAAIAAYDAERDRSPVVVA